MSIELVTLILFGMLILGLLLGIPLGFCMGGSAVIATIALWGMNGLYNVVLQAYHAMNLYVLVAVPLFVFMAFILEKAGVASALYETIYAWMGPVRGGLAVGTVIICTIFAAMSGLSAAAVLTMGIIALPSMMKHKYNTNMALGSIAAGGALGILIPPSTTMIFIGVFADLSIGRLFMGGVFPGLLLSGLFCVYILIKSYLEPHLAPALPREERKSWSTKFRLLKNLVLPIFVIIAIMGSIFAGAATTTESAAIGVLGVIVCAIINRKFNFKMLWEATMKTVRLGGMLMWIMMGAFAFVAVYQALGAQNLVKGIFNNIPGGPWVTIIFMQLSLFVLGCFLDPGGIIFITVPIYFPIVKALGFDPLWFGLLYVVNFEMGYLTPPFGYNLFYLKSIVPPSLTLKDIYRSIWPFVVLQGIGLAICMVFPQLILWLPDQMFIR